MPYIKAAEWRQIQEKLKNSGRPVATLQKAGKPRKDKLNPKRIIHGRTPLIADTHPFSFMTGCRNNYGWRYEAEDGMKANEILDTVLKCCSIALQLAPTQIMKSVGTGKWHERLAYEYVDNTEGRDFIVDVALFIIHSSESRTVYGDHDDGQYDDADGAWKTLEAYFDARSLEYTGWEFGFLDKAMFWSDPEWAAYEETHPEAKAWER